MCSQFLLKVRLKDIADSFGIVISDESSAQPMDLLVSPYKRSPVWIVEKDQNIMRSMQFSLLPAWSKEARLKFSTHNARLDTITEKPTWRDAFKKRHALVPISGFIEPIYENDLAGNMVEFFSNQTLFAAAIWEPWVDQKTGEVIESFAIITDAPYPMVDQVGHDRSPLFLEESAFPSWLDPSTPHSDPSFLRKHRLIPSLEYKIHRPLKTGWEKRRNSK